MLWVCWRGWRALLSCVNCQFHVTAHWCNNPDGDYSTYLSQSWPCYRLRQPHSGYGWMIVCAGLFSVYRRSGTRGENEEGSDSKDLGSRPQFPPFRGQAGCSYPPFSVCTLVSYKISTICGVIIKRAIVYSFLIEVNI